MNPQPSLGPSIGSGVVVLMLILGAVSLVGKVFKERTTVTTLPTITEYEQIEMRAATSSLQVGSTSLLR